MNKHEPMLRMIRESKLPEGVEKDQTPTEPGLDRLCGLYVMKDRDWGERCKKELYFVKGRYTNSFNSTI